MKIMDLPGEDSECQVEAVITSKSKKSKQARLPFQTLSSDSPVANKKRELTGAADSRNAKRIKVTIKENACETLKKTEIEDSAVIEEIIVDEEEENKSSEADDEKDSSKPVSNEKQDSKNKKSTPSRGASKNKKSESKVPVNALTKFFKKVDNNDSQKTKDETQTPSKTEEEKSKKANDVNNTSDKISKTSKDQKNKDTSKNLNHDTEQKKEINKTNETIEITVESETETNKISEVSMDVELKDSFSSNENEGGKTDTSVLNRTENMDVDSDIALLSDDSHNVDDDDDDDDDSGKSDTDSKRTEHEDTDSKDDVNKSRLNHSSLSKQNKLLDSATKAKKLTPKQLERKLEIQKKRESREKQRSEREKKLQEERENRKKEKEEKRREREEKERLLKEQKKKEKELKEQKKQAEIEQKQKEKEAKEEDRRKKEEAKEEEKRRKEEERLEAEKKKLKAASNFVSFFVPKKPTEMKPVEKESKVENRNFMPFEIKADMRVAPLIRRNLSESEKSKLDKFINSGVNKSELYISDIKNKKFQIRKSERTWPYEANDDVVIIDEDEENSNVVQGTKSVEKHRAKLLLFHDNRRPPYWGTWRKKSKTVNPRRPLSKDTQWFDYEVDSDDEWEEEEPGESLHGSDDEKEKDEENAEENEYDVDNDFMVPHGYLSEEEIGADEEDEEDDDLNPEMQKKKLKLLGEQFEAERNTKTKKLKPKVIGCVWLNAENAYPENTPSYAIQFLTIHHAWVREIPLTLTATADTDNLYDNENGTPSSKHGVTSSARKALALEEAMPDLIRMLHGNTHGRAFLVKEFLEYLSKKKEGEKPIPKAKLHQKIREIATWVPCREAGPMQDKHCWYVAEDLRTKYLGAEKLTMPNRWTYCLTPKKKSIIPETIETPDEKEKEKEKEKKLVPLITKFTKTITAEEMQKLLTEKPPTPVSKVAENPATSAPTTSASKPTPPLNRPPKRAALISVPRGEPLPKPPRMSLMNKFVANNSPMASTTFKKANVNDDDDDDDDDCCMIIDEPDEKEKPKPVLAKTDSANKTSDSVNEKSKNDQTASTNGEVDSEKPEKAP